MINEPTAASLVYAYETIETKINKYIVVIDLGGGTLYISLLQFLKNENGIFCTVQFTFWYTKFGEEDFDYALMRWIIGNNFDKKKSFNLRLKRACENAKIELSKENSTTIKLEQYQHCKDINKTLTRKEFEDI